MEIGPLAGPWAWARLAVSVTCDKLQLLPLVQGLLIDRERLPLKASKAHGQAQASAALLSEAEAEKHTVCSIQCTLLAC